ncbi:aminotransferase class III-fold pyridoxal phosphate-dependent enzyme [Agrobacterium rubi]|uniref:aminotransferase class III-fold pyridoxal phosphate-dependent enzyme n=1 Tax=Agrobacterium rubi TaxID=28099 RepID=UPI001573BFB6|nr:aminotransferase class III-fold pyridoxal phosphate-dependent enzyme [Agrobacterium rubi]NTF10531.1 aminotransferase class III-fold pyridoxal phosphate-dependent enzyme [Agrobacterium rubi]NTF22925.1 aminotransferase class III-fold pyridoxal phosphate-dependent enzyme [Agrobacterium rubi]NTF29856.1 aminotransferase class III-fold pyridoxal phosphate-dependent enzyme [Agrobacterium rubi]
MNKPNSVVEMDQNWVHPLSNWTDQEVNGPSRILASAKGLWIQTLDGRDLFDAFSGLWCVNAGYGQNSIVEAASDQMRALPYAPAYFGQTFEAGARFANALAQRAPGDCRHVYFTPGGGSDAVDTSIRLVRYFNNIIGKPEKKHFIALDKGYHGVSTTGSGLTALSVFHRHFDVPTPTQHHIPTPSPYRHPEGHDSAAVIKTTIDALYRKVEEIGVDKVAAFICEPIQGSGGVHVPPEGFLKAVRKACDDLDLLLIIDEVITGFGRTGPLFACSAEDVAPDLMVAAKGLTSAYVPMGAVFISDRLFREIAVNTPSGTLIGHGHTYAGHPVAAAAGLAALRLYEEGGVLANGQKIAPYFLLRLNELRDLPYVGDVRGRGLLAAVELVADTRTKEPFSRELNIAERLLAAAERHQILFRAYADGVIALAPALTITKEEVDILVNRLRAVIAEATSEIAG